MYRTGWVLLLQAGCAWWLGVSPAALLGLVGLGLLTRQVCAAAAAVSGILRRAAVLGVLTGAWMLLHFVGSGGAVLSGRALLCGMACLVPPVVLQA